MIKVGIVGAAGYAGAELVRICLRHPQFELAVITSNADNGKKLTDLYPAFLGLSDLEYSAHDNPELFTCDVVFLATPHTVAMKSAPGLLEAGVTVIDLSADYRLHDQAVYEKWYGVEHTSADLLSKALFGLPELFAHDLIRGSLAYRNGEAVLIACAGCYPTATSLASAPVIRLTEGVVVADAISGVSGAGRSATARTHFCSANENFEAYGVTSHRHTPEIEQILEIPDRLIFTPHLAPASRGLLSTVTMQLSPEARQKETAESIHRRYQDAYAQFPFVEVLPLGSQPKTSSVVGTNRAHVGVAFNAVTGSVIATCAIDNIVKGAAGQAVQCANIICGFDQTCALETVANPS